MIQSRLCLLIILFNSSSTLGQNSMPGLWNSETISLPGSSLSRFGANAQFEFHDNQILRDFQYFEIKGALTYFFNRHFTIATGAGQYTTYETGTLKKTTTIEKRMYQQISNNEFFSWIKLESRLTIEQRWIDGVYYNRFRYRLTAFAPVNKPKIEAHTLFVSGFEELFLTNGSPSFQENRCYGGVGYQLDKSWIIQTGITSQYNHSATRSASKNYATLLLLYRIYRKRQIAREYVPSAMN